MQYLFGLGSLWLQLAAALLIAAILVRGQRNLQIFAVLSGLAALTHFLVTDQAGTGLGWVILFLAVAAIRLVMSILRARSGITRREERDLLEKVLQVEEPSQQRRLLDLMTWRDMGAGDVLMRQSQSEPPLIYVATGSAHVEHDGQMVGKCGPGDFLGEMSLITGEKASATVTAAEPMRVASFDRDALHRLSSGLPELARAFDHALNRGLAAKIQRMNRSTPQE